MTRNKLPHEYDIAGGEFPCGIEPEPVEFQDVNVDSFRPMFTPVQMLTLGVFHSNYFGPELPKEFPRSWERISGYSKKSGVRSNLFQVHSGMTLAEWERRGWINEADPLGWFQWYCRFYLGRRIKDDKRQIARWRAFTRHRDAIRIHGNKDLTNRMAQRQALLQWAYNPYCDIVR